MQTYHVGYIYAVFPPYFNIIETANSLINCWNYIESFKGLRLNPYLFYLVILPLDIRWELKKFHIKPLGKTKIQVFCQDIYRYDCFYTHRDYMNISMVWHRD